MRTNIDMDDQLVKRAMRSSGAATKKAVVEAGLRLLVQTHAQGSIRKLRGKIQWDGNLDESRLGRMKEDRMKEDRTKDRTKEDRD